MLTCNYILHRVHSECEENEDCKNLFSRASAPPHETANIEQGIQNDEERIPKANARKHGIEVDLKVLGYLKDDLEDGIDQR